MILANKIAFDQAIQPRTLVYYTKPYLTLCEPDEKKSHYVDLLQAIVKD